MSLVIRAPSKVIISIYTIQHSSLTNWTSALDCPYLEYVQNENGEGNQ